MLVDEGRPTSDDCRSGGWYRDPGRARARYHRSCDTKREQSTLSSAPEQQLMMIMLERPESWTLSTEITAFFNLWDFFSSFMYFRWVPFVTVTSGCVMTLIHATMF